MPYPAGNEGFFPIFSINHIGMTHWPVGVIADLMNSRLKRALEAFSAVGSEHNILQQSYRGGPLGDPSL